LSPFEGLPFVKDDEDGTLLSIDDDPRDPTLGDDELEEELPCGCGIGSTGGLSLDIKGRCA
jgi:hypothetical protein